MSRRLVVAAVLAAAVALDLAPAGAGAASPLDVFHRFYKEKSPDLRLKAVSQLAGQRGAGVVEALLEAVDDEDREVRERAAGVLSETRDAADEIAAIVRLGLGRQPPEVRVQAVHALAVCGGKAV